MTTIKGLEQYEILISKIPDDFLLEEYPDTKPEDVLVVPVLVAFDLRDKDENQEERNRVLAILQKNEKKLIKEVGSNHFKVVVK